MNLPLRVVPIVLTVAMITTEMPAAIKPYSIAVAPYLSFRNEKTLDIRAAPCCFTGSILPRGLLRMSWTNPDKVACTSVRIFVTGNCALRPVF